MAEQNKPVAAQQQQAMAKKYKIKGGANSFTHPVLGEITKDHIEGPRSETFIKALENCTKNRKCKPLTEWLEEAK